jgi:hypothetical protein
MAHEGGAAAGGDDMRGSRVPWATIGAIEWDGLRLLPPLDQAWLRRRTFELFRLWEHEPAVALKGAPLRMFASPWKSGDPDSTAPTRVLLTGLP